MAVSHSVHVPSSSGYEEDNNPDASFIATEGEVSAC